MRTKFDPVLISVYYNANKKTVIFLSVVMWIFDFIGAHHFIVFMIENMTVPHIAGFCGGIERILISAGYGFLYILWRKPDPDRSDLPGISLDRVFPAIFMGRGFNWSI